MSISRVILPTTTILTGNTTDLVNPFFQNTLVDDDAYDICVIAPAVLVEACKVQVSQDNITWSVLQNKQMADVILTAGKATPFDPGGLLWRLQLGVAATNNYTFQVVKRILITGHF